MTDRENGDTRMNGVVTSGTNNRAATEIIRIIGDLEVVPVLARQVIMSLLLLLGIKTGAEMIIGDPNLRRRLLTSVITMLPPPLTITTFPPTIKM